MDTRAVEPRLFAVTIERFNELFSSDVVALPRNVAAVGWLPACSAWYCAPFGVVADDRFRKCGPGTMRFLSERVYPDADMPFWLLYCFFDGWRENIEYDDNFRWVPAPGIDELDAWDGPAGTVPILTAAQRRVACYGKHRGDPSAALLPEGHYLSREYYRPLFDMIDRADRPWCEKRAEAIFCAGNHGSAVNYLPPLATGRPHPRQYLARLTLERSLPIRVHLDQGIAVSRQLEFRYILDVDGYARTWDAFAWKMYGGSTVLVRESHWESFFTRCFEPWTHFVPVAHDFSDLAQKIEWCMDNEEACRRIAASGRRRAIDVYDPGWTARQAARELAPARFSSGADGGSTVPRGQRDSQEP